MRVCLSAHDHSSLATVLRLGLNSHLAQQLRLPHLVPSLRALATAGHWRSVFSCLDAMADVRSIAPDARLIVALANIAVNYRAFQQSLRLFQRMRQRSLPFGPIAYSVLLKTLGRTGNVVAVKDVIIRIREEHVHFDTILLNSAVDALVRCNDLQGARRLIVQPESADLLDVTTFNTLIRGFAVSGRLEEAFCLASDMTTAGLKPNFVTTNTLLTACITAGDFDTAWSLLNPQRSHNSSSISSQSSDDFHVHQRSSSNNSPAPSRLNILPFSDTPVLKNDEEDSDEDSDASPGQQPSPLTKFHIDNLPCPDGDHEQLRIALTAMLCGLAEAGRIQEALFLLQDMTRLGTAPNSITYSALISACFRYGAVDPALYVFRSIPPPSAKTPELIRNILVCNSLIFGLCGLDDVEYVHKAATLVNRMLQSNDSDSQSSYARPTIATFNGLIDGFVRFRLFDEAEYYVKLMHRYGIRPNIVSFTILMKGYADAQRFTDAKRTFKQINIRRLTPDRVALNAFVSVCARSGDVVAADKVLRYMEGKGGGLSPGAQSYTPLLAAYARVQDDGSFWGLYTRMRTNSVPLNVFVIELSTAYVAFTVQSLSKRLGGSDTSDAPVVDISMEGLARRAAQMLCDGVSDGLEPKILRKSRRKLMQVFKDSRCRAYFRGLDAPELRSASEVIFERHGWNHIDSGWRFL